MEQDFPSLTKTIVNRGGIRLEWTKQGIQLLQHVALEDNPIIHDFFMQVRRMWGKKEKEQSE